MEKGATLTAHSPPEGGDARWGVVLDDLQGAGELVDDDGFGFDAVDQVEALVAHGDGP